MNESENKKFDRSPSEKMIIREIYEKINKIDSNLNGDKDAGIEGIYDKVKKHGKVIEEYQKDKIKVVTAGTLLAGATTLLLNAFKIFK